MSFLMRLTVMIDMLVLSAVYYMDDLFSGVR